MSSYHIAINCLCFLLASPGMLRARVADSPLLLAAVCLLTGPALGSGQARPRPCCQEVNSLALTVHAGLCHVCYPGTTHTYSMGLQTLGLCSLSVGCSAVVWCCEGSCQQAGGTCVCGFCLAAPPKLLLRYTRHA